MSKGIRLNSEKKIDNDTFKIKIGTTNKDNPQAIYFEGRAFIEPLCEKDDYNDDISEIKRNFKHSISSSLKDNVNFDNRFILDFGIASNRMVKNKRSFMSFQFLLKQNGKNILKLKEVKERTSDFIDSLMDSLGNDIVSHNFSIYKSKK